jgi:ribosome modulation factor
MNNRDYHAGYQAGLAEECYRSMVIDSDWLDGWRDGQRERVKRGLPVANALPENNLPSPQAD